jgi:hypothetical protein
MVVVVASGWGPVSNFNVPCILVAGAGRGNLIVDKTKRIDFLPDDETEGRFASQGAYLLVPAGDVLGTIVATGKDFKTNAGRGPGDTEKHVRQVYGKPTISTGSAPQGRSTDRDHRRQSISLSGNPLHDLLGESLLLLSRRVSEIVFSVLLYQVR